MKLAPKLAPWQDEHVELFLLDENSVSAAYVEWLHDEQVNRYLESRFAQHNEASVRSFVRSCLDDPKTLFLGIRSLKLGGRHVGNIKLSPIDSRHGLGEIGIMVGDRAAWGIGVGSAAIRLLCGIGKQDLGLRKITAGCYASNVGSERAFLKAGFQIEGLRRNHFVVDGRAEDLTLMCYWPSAETVITSSNR